MSAPPPESPAARSEPPSPVSRGFAWFGLGLASWFGAWGLQGVLFTWLVVGELQSPAEWLGIAQSSTMLPALAFLLVGGVAADRVDNRRLLMRLHCLAAVPVLLLALAVATGVLSLAIVIAYGLCIGILSAFVMPARATLLSHVAGPDMMRSVSSVTAVQFGAQATGALAGGAAAWAGSVSMLGVQALVLCVGAVAMIPIPPPPPPEPRAAGRSTLGEIQDGLREVARTPRLLAPVVLVMAVGTLFIGPFMVVFPLLVRDLYDGAVADLSVVLMLFPIGTIGGSLAIRARGGIRRKGRALLLALLCGASALGLIGTGLPFGVFLAATLAWGLAGSVFINVSRTLVQETAPVAHRARVLSVYQLGFVGAAPIGALLAGALAGAVGPLATLQLSAGLMVGVVAAIGLGTDTARLT